MHVKYKLVILFMEKHLHVLSNSLVIVIIHLFLTCIIFESIHPSHFNTNFEFP